MAEKVSTKFKGLLADMKRQPKDAKGKFKDRDFAKYVSRNLAEIRKFAKPFKKGKKKVVKSSKNKSKQLKIF